MKTFIKTCIAALLVLSNAAFAGWDSYVIRNSNGGNAPAITSNPDGSLAFLINEGSQKAAWGTNDANGSTLGDILSLSISRLDDYTRFSTNTGPASGPYLNFWVTDGNGNYAVVANEPSNPEWDNDPTYNQWNMTYDYMSNKVAKVYETPGWNTGSSWIHNLLNKTASDIITFAEVSSLVIEAPSVSYITTPANSVGGGAPDTLSGNIAYGVNWVFGDTLSNYVTNPTPNDPGYVVKDPSITVAAVPAPGAIVLSSLGTMLIGRIRRRA